MSDAGVIDPQETQLVEKVNAFLETLDEKEAAVMEGVFAGAAQATEVDSDEEVEGYFLGGLIKNCAPYSACWYACLAANRGRAVYCGDYCRRRYPGCGR